MDYTKEKQPYIIYLETFLDEYRKVLPVELEQNRRFRLKEIRFHEKPYLGILHLEVFSSAAPSRQIESIDLQTIAGGPALTSEHERVYSGVPLNWQFPQGDTIQVHITGQGLFDINPPAKIRIMLIGEYIPEGGL